MSKKPPFKLDEWQEETIEIDVNVPKFDPKTNQVIGYEKQSMPVVEKVYRSEASPQQVICGNHYYECVDKHKYIFKCKNCSYSRVAFPCSYDLVNGKLIPRKAQPKA